MPLPLRFHAEALDELQAAAVYYAERSPSASEGFLAVVDEGLDRIVEWPRAAPVWPGLPDVRRAVLPRYPYALVYLVELEDVFLIAVEHVKRRPGYWLDRVPR